MVDVMEVTSIDDLDDLNDDELWKVAADPRVSTIIRHEAIQRWLFPEETNPDIKPDDADGGRLRELRERATILQYDEVEEDDIEDLDHIGPFFDGQGRLIVEHDGVLYLVDSMDEDEA